MAADHHEIAVRQEPVEIPCAAKLAESWWQRLDGGPVAAGADHPHAEGSAEPTDIAPDSTSAHDARSLTFQQNRSICAVVERARTPIDRGPVEAFGEVQNASNRVFRHRQRVAHASRGCHHHAAAPWIAHEQIAGARGTLMKPFQPRCPSAQIEWKWPATKDHFSSREEAIAFLAGS